MGSFRGAVLLLTVLALATRLLWLAADPPLFKALDELIDEGYWAHNARSAVVFGERFPDDLAQGPAAAPLFDWLVERTFRALGVGYASLRLIPALASALLVPLVIAVVLPAAGAGAAVLAGVLTLANHELFAFGRLGLPESLHVLLAVAGAGLWLHRRNAAWSAAAGVVFALSALAKMNVLVVAGLAGVWALELAQARRHLARDVAWFVGALGIVGSTWVIVDYLPHARIFALDNLALNRDRLLVSFSDLGRLPLHFLNSRFWGLPSTFLLVALAARRVAQLAPAFGQGWRAGVAAFTRLDTLAIGWIAGFALPTALLVRATGERRLVIVLVPLAMLAALALRLEDAAPAAAAPAPAASYASRAAGVALAVAVTIVGLALVFTSGYGWTLWLGGAPGAIVAGLVLAFALDRLAARGALTVGMTTPAIVVVSALLPALNAARFAEWASSAPGWIVTLAALATALATVVGSRAAVRVTLVVYLVWGALGIGVNLARPTYTLRETSAAIGARAAPGDAIVGSFAHALAFGNATLPIWYTPSRRYNQLLNPDLARFRVRWILAGKGSQSPAPEEYPFALTRVDAFDLLPAPRGGPKVHLDLYRRVP